VTKTGDLATLRFLFAKIRVDECNRDFSTAACPECYTPDDYSCGNPHGILISHSLAISLMAR
jgi:hypothetical protein